MTGLEKMTSQILDEAKTQADRKIAEAEGQAQKILDEAKAEAEKTAAGISKKSEMEVANYRERIASSIDLQKRTRILQAKQEMIEDILKRSYEKMADMEEGSYFDLILKMVENYADAQEGIIYFSKKDLSRMPAGFQEKIRSKAAAKGGALTISPEGADIENGFVLAYGGIEENCTLRAIFDAKKDELSDRIHRLLFA